MSTTPTPPRCAVCHNLESHTHHDPVGAGTVQYHAFVSPREGEAEPWPRGNPDGDEGEWLFRDERPAPPAERRPAMEVNIPQGTVITGGHFVPSRPSEEAPRCNQTDTEGLCHDGCKQRGYCYKFAPRRPASEAPAASTELLTQAQRDHFLRRAQENPLMGSNVVIGYEATLRQLERQYLAQAADLSRTQEALREARKALIETLIHGRDSWSVVQAIGEKTGKVDVKVATRLARENADWFRTSLHSHITQSRAALTTEESTNGR